MAVPCQKMNFIKQLILAKTFFLRWFSFGSVWSFGGGCGARLSGKSMLPLPSLHRAVEWSYT